MSDQPQAPVGVPMLPVMRSDKYFSAYMNGFSIRVSVVDFSIVFLQNTAMQGSNMPVLVEEGMVAMPLPVFKQLTTSLSAALAALEEAIGPIKIDASSAITPAHIDALIGPIRNVKFTD